MKCTAVTVDISQGELPRGSDVRFNPLHIEEGMTVSELRKQLDHFPDDVRIGQVDQQLSTRMFRIVPAELQPKG